MDPITAWGLGAVSKAVTSILTDVAKSDCKAMARNLLKAHLGSGFGQQQDEVSQKALGRCLVHFIELFRRELEHTEGLSFLREQFEPAMKTFVAHPETLHILGGAFDLRVRRLEARSLSILWTQLGLPGLPAEFDWDVLLGGFLRELRSEIKHAPELQALLNADNLERATEAVEHLAGVMPGFDLNGYRTAILHVYQHLKLDSLDISGQDYRVRLRKVFVPQEVREALPLYELPKDVLRRLQSEGAIDSDMRVEEWDHLRRRHLECPLLGIGKVLEDSQCGHIVVLGDAGSGKSSLAQNILLEWADRRGEPLPILVELRAYAQDIGTPANFLEFIESGEGCMWHFNQREIDLWLRTREALVIFEGLDEIFDTVRRYETTRAILRFAAEYPRARIIVTSRTVGYNAQELRNAGFRHFTLQDFSEHQINQFLRVWHDEAIAVPTDRHMLIERLQNSLAESASLRELAGNPLLLTMLAVLNRNQELPRDRAEAYGQMSRVLLYQWDVNKFLRENGGPIGERVGRHEKEEMLRRIAMTAQGGAEGIAANLMPKSRLEQSITEYLRNTLHFEQPEIVARLMIRQLRERNFVLCQTGADYFSFVHRTFLEYYCASAFVERFYESLSIEQLRDDTFVSHWRDESWREILKLISGMLPEVHSAKLIGWLLQQESPAGDFENVFLAVECWKELLDPGKAASLGKTLWQRIMEVIEFRPVRDLYPRIDNWGAVFPKNEASRVHTIDVRTRAIAALGAAFAGDSNALTWLRNCAIHRSQWALRQAAIRALSKHWSTHPDLRGWLLWAARPEEDENVRITAVQAIARQYRGDAETSDWLRSVAESDLAHAVRTAAARELARGWADDAEIQAFAKSVIAVQ